MRDTRLTYRGMKPEPCHGRPERQKCNTPITRQSTVGQVRVLHFLSELAYC